MSIPLRDQDQGFVITRLPKDVRELVKTYDLIVGGGFIRDTIAGGKPSDIDLFGASDDIVRNAASALCLQRGSQLVETPNAFTVLSPPRMPVQIIRRWLYTEPQSVLESFDFTVCQAVLWYERKNGWKSLVADDFYPDLAARRLVYTSPKREEAAGGSMMRVRKFLTRGYTIQAGALARVIARLVLGVRATEKQPGITETEEGLAGVLNGLLREVDPLVAIDGVDLIDEHDVNPQGSAAQ